MMLTGAADAAPPDAEGQDGSGPPRATLPLLDELRPLFERELRRSRRYERPLSVLVFALPPLPRERRAEGLARLARLLRDHLRETDLVARVPGRDEVVALLPEADAPTATGGCERVRSLWAHEDGWPPLHAGVATYPDEALVLDDLLGTARPASTAPRGPARDPVRPKRGLVDA